MVKQALFVTSLVIVFFLVACNSSQVRTYDPPPVATDQIALQIATTIPTSMPMITATFMQTLIPTSTSTITPTFTPTTTPTPTLIPIATMPLITNTPVPRTEASVRPEVQITNIVSGQRLSGIFRVEGTAWDASGIDRIRVRFENFGGKGYHFSAIYDDPSGKWAVDITPEMVPDGVYNLSVEARDKEFMKKFTTAYDVIIKNVPQVELTGLAPATTNNGFISVKEGADFTVLASVVKPGNLGYTYTFSDICSGTIANTADTTFESNVMSLRSGTYTCTVTITDKDGDADSTSISIVVSSK